MDSHRSLSTPSFFILIVPLVSSSSSSSSQMLDRYPSYFSLALTADDIEAAFAKGRVASLLGIEGGHAIDSSLGALRMFYK